MIEQTTDRAKPDHDLIVPITIQDTREDSFNEPTMADGQK